MRKRFFINLFLVWLFLISNLLTNGIVWSVSVDDLKNTISGRQELIKKLDDEIKQYEQKIDLTRKEGSSLKKELQQIDLTRQKLQTNLDLTQNKIIVTDSTIINLQKNIPSFGRDIFKKLIPALDYVSRGYDN